MKTSASIEALESRIAPAPLVTVSFLKGALVLTSDNGDQDFAITGFDADTTQLTASGSTLFHVDGQTDTNTLLLTGPLKSVSIKLGDGSDHVVLAGISVAGDLTVEGGIGGNSTELQAIAVGGSLKVTGGVGADSVQGSGSSVTVKKNVNLQLGDGTNFAGFEGSLFQVGGQFIYQGGTGFDTVAFEAFTQSITGNTTITTGAGGAGIRFGTDSVTKLGKKATFDTSGSLAGNATSVALSGQLSIGGDLQMTDGAADLTFTVSGSLIPRNSLDVRGKWNLVSGAGSAIGALYADVTAGSITMDVSASGMSSIGTDSLAATKGFKYIGSAGDDFLRLGLNSSAQRKVAGSSLTVDLGGGANIFQLLSYGGSFQTSKITGGSAEDNISFTVTNAKLGSIDVQSGAGMDFTNVSLFNSTATGKIRLAAAAGTEINNAGVNGANSVFGNVEFSSPRDYNSFSFGGNGFAGDVTVKGKVKFVGGSGQDYVGISATTFPFTIGSVDIALGDGLNNTSIVLPNGSIRSLAVAGGTGSDIVSVFGPGSVGAVTLKLGSGNDNASFSGGDPSINSDFHRMTIGSLTYLSGSTANDSETLNLKEVMMTGKFTGKFGVAASNLYIEDSIIGGTVSVSMGDGFDTVNIEIPHDSLTTTTFLQAATFDLGPGDDQLAFGDNLATAQVITKSTLKVIGGAGTNTILLDRGNVFAKPPIVL